MIKGRHTEELWSETWRKALYRGLNVHFVNGLLVMTLKPDCLLLQDTDFMPEGGAIAYHCEHLYPVSGDDHEIHTACLKGRDAAFLSASQLLGMKGEIFALWNATSGKPYASNWTNEDEVDEDSDDNEDVKVDNDDDEDEEDTTNEEDEGVEKDLDDTVVFSKKWQSYAFCCEGFPEYDQEDNCLDSSGIPCKAPAAIKFVNDRPDNCFRPGLTVASYGNEPSTDAYYYTAAIVVQVPAAKDRNVPKAMTDPQEKQKHESQTTAWWAWCLMMYLDV